MEMNNVVNFAMDSITFVVVLVILNSFTKVTASTNRGSGNIAYQNDPSRSVFINFL